MKKVFILLFVLFLIGTPAALADRGMVPIEPSISVYEPGQKAIIAWNGREEILILSTDVNAAENTTALEIMPLPSDPKRIEKASFESFVTIQDLIWKQAPYVLGRSYEGADKTQSVEVTFHEKIGSHDITVVKASDASELTEWAEDFLKSNGISEEISLQKFESVIEDYMARGFRFFVLDLIEVSTEENSVEPILYQFETSFLYYPLKISSPIPGETKITLFLITKEKIQSSIYYSPHNPLRTAFYRSSTRWEPIQLNLTKGQLSIIDLRIGELFEGNVWLTVLEYDGPLKGLTKDLMIAEGDPITPNGWLNGEIIYKIFGWITGAFFMLVGTMFLTIGIKRTKSRFR